MPIKLIPIPPGKMATSMQIPAEVVQAGKAYAALHDLAFQRLIQQLLTEAMTADPAGVKEACRRKGWLPPAFLKNPTRTRPQRPQPKPKKSR